MIIGYDGSRAFTKDRTGTENYSFQFLRSLTKIDKINQYIVYIQPLTFNSAIAEGYVNTFPKNFSFKLISWPRFWTQGGLALQTFKDNLDALFVPAHTLPLIRKPGLKTVVTVHDLGSEYLPSMHQLKQRFYLSLMQKYQLKGATKIIAVSKATKADLVEKVGINDKKIEVIYEGYDKERFKVQSAKFKINEVLVNTLRQYELVPESYFLFVGTVQPRKNLERLIQAYQMYVSRGPASSVSRRASSLTSFAAATRRDPSSLSPLETKLVIVGSKGWLSDEIYKLPKRLGIEKKVKFLGYVPEKNLPALYSGAIALTFPSLFEGFGLPILEAQACGCPVITSNTSSMPEVAGKGAILVNPHEIEAIAHAMIRVQGRGYRVQLIKKGFENVKRFSWEKCAAQTLKVFEEIQSTKSDIRALVFEFMKKDILGIKIDDVSIDEATKIVTDWLLRKGKHYIVTPNPEIVVMAQKDEKLKKIINQADLAVPDGIGLKLSGDIVCYTPGMDLMERLILMAQENGFTIGLLGGRGGVAEKCANRLKEKYPKLTVSYALEGPVIPAKAGIHNNKDLWIPDQVRDDKVDLLFVAFGPPKQEKWIAKNLPNLDVKVAMGVGGAFDFLSGEVPRAPKFIRNLGFEWLFRLMIQPWRIKRQLALVKFIWLLTRHKLKY